MISALSMDGAIWRESKSLNLVSPEPHPTGNGAVALVWREQERKSPPEQGLSQGRKSGVIRNAGTPAWLIEPRAGYVVA